MTDTSELVKTGVALYAAAEVGLRKAQDSLLELAKLHEQAYSNGHLTGAEAIQANASLVELAGNVATIRHELIELHKRDAAYAEAAGVDIAQPYAELPALGAGVTPLSVGR